MEPAPTRTDPFSQQGAPAVNSELPPGALIKFQRVSRGIRFSSNYRWVLYEDGRWFLGKNSPSYAGDRGWFEGEIPSKPTKTLPAGLVKEVESQLRAAGFFSQPEVQSDPETRDGSNFIVTATLDGQTHEVTYNGVYTPLIEFLSQIALDHG